MKRFDVKSLVIGGLVVGGACMVMGMVAAYEPAPQIGRFQIDCTQTTCYMVDTVTGQAWASHAAAFGKPKIKGPEERTATALKGYVGRWVAVDPDQTEGAITFNADGTLVTEDDEGGDTYSGTWRVEGNCVRFDVDKEPFTGEISANGQLILWEDTETDDKLVFKPAK